MKYLLLIFIFLVSLNSSSQSYTNEIIIPRDGVEFKFEFNCDGKPCQYGQFVTGDYWVTPYNISQAVTLISISPNGEENGAMINPDLLRDDSNNIISFENQKQGILNAYEHYDDDLNIMNSLPLDLHGDSSVFKIASMNDGCGTDAIEIGCVKSATVLTILSFPPKNQGETIFRPPFHGDWKPLYEVDRVRMERLPSLPQISEASEIVGDFGYNSWLVPQIELYHKGMGEFHRATIPHMAQTPYAADQAKDFLEDLTKLFGLTSIEDKKMATYSLIQKGIDNYAIYKMGVPFQSGAGQHLGKKPPIVFFAAMYDDLELLNDVRSISSNQNLIKNSFFQEDSQIKMGKSNMPIWGDDQSIEDVHWYFTRMYPRIDTQGSASDPYGYIDGPAGGIHPDENEAKDRNYLNVAGGPLIGYAFVQHLMPWMKYASNDIEILLWSDRIYDGYGVENFEGGLWTLPDPVAPFDINESSDCNPSKIYSTGITKCLNYRKTWGPVEMNLEEYVQHNQDPYTYGRMPELHGRKVSFNRLPSIVKDHWAELRPCSDPNSSDYPCLGLGEVPNEVLSSDEIFSSKKKPYSLLVKDNILELKSNAYNSTLEIILYDLKGIQILQENLNDNYLRVDLRKSNYSSGFYIYRINMNEEVYKGKIIFK